jgi:hypothetical protein
MLNMECFLRRSAIGIVAGMISSVVLIATLHSVLLGIFLGAAIGLVYSVGFRTTPFAYAESAFTAATLGVPLWAVFCDQCHRDSSPPSRT